MIFQCRFFLIELGYLCFTSGFDWGLTNAPVHFWHAISSSSDGINVAAVTFNGGIYRSTDYGLQWTEIYDKDSYWTGIASDTTGRYLAASSLTHGVYYTRNYGSEWNRSTIPTGRSWVKIASDSTGQYLAAVAAYGPIYYSIFYAYNFFASDAPDALWTSITVCSDGSRMLATAAVADDYPDGIYSSTDYGVTWSLVPYTSGIMWQGIILAYEDELKVVAVSTGGIYLSTDGGATWSLSSAPTHQWTSVTTSSTGQYLVAGTGSSAVAGDIYISSDYGVTWTLESTAPGVSWHSLSSDYSGDYIVATVGDVNGGGIYMNKLTTVPTPSPTVVTALEGESEGITHFPIGGIIGIIFVLFSLCLAIITLSFCYYERKLENASTEKERKKIMEEGNKSLLLSVRFAASPIGSVFQQPSHKVNNNSNNSSYDDNKMKNNQDNAAVYISPLSKKAMTENNNTNSKNNRPKSTRGEIINFNDGDNDHGYNNKYQNSPNVITTIGGHDEYTIKLNDMTNTNNSTVLGSSSSNPYRLSRRVNPNINETTTAAATMEVYSDKVNNNNNSGSGSARGGGDRGSARMNYPYSDHNNNVTSSNNNTGRSQRSRGNSYGGGDYISAAAVNGNVIINDEDDDEEEEEEEEEVIHTTGLLNKSHKENAKYLRADDGDIATDDNEDIVDIDVEETYIDK